MRWPRPVRLAASCREITRPGRVPRSAGSGGPRHRHGCVGRLNADAASASSTSRHHNTASISRNDDRWQPRTPTARCQAGFARGVADMLADGQELWEVIHAIHNNGECDANMFGFLPDQIEKEIKETTWRRQWQMLTEEELVKQLHGVFRQIEPVSMVLRFIDPKRHGIISSDDRLPKEKRAPLHESHRDNVLLRQLATRNLTLNLFSENPKLKVAESLLSTNAALAGQIAGIEFEQLVSKRVPLTGDTQKDDSLPTSSTALNLRTCATTVQALYRQAVLGWQIGHLPGHWILPP